MMNRSCVVALCAAIAFVAVPAYAGITISLKPARTSGVSPLYVFFDATGTTSTDVSDPFGDLLYQWNFGDSDPVSGGGALWKVSGKPKNTATGPVAAHVYECAGPSNCTATVTLTVRAPDGVVNSATTTITVYPVSSIDGSAPGSKTVCVSASGDFSGCPNGAARVASTASFDSILQQEINGSGMRRVLFRRGDTWSGSGNYTLTADGPGIIGAFGDSSLPKPFVQVTTNLNSSALIKCYGPDASGNGGGRDWRIEDLKIRGGPSQSSSNGSFFDATYGHTCTQMLLYRLDVANPPGYSFWATYGMNIFDVPSNGAVHDQVALVDSTSNRSYGYQLYWSGARSALLGDDLGPSDTTHVARVSCAKEMAIEDNRLAGAYTHRHELKLHADGNACPGALSRLIEISDNRFESSQGSDWSVVIGGSPEAVSTVEHVQDVIFERNWVGPTGIGTTNDGSSQIGVVAGASHAIYRNNLFSGTGGPSYGYIALSVFSEDTAVTPGNVQVYSNTCYTADAPIMTCANVSSSSSTTIRDNLLYHPLSDTGGASSVSTCGGTNCSSDHNVAQIGTSSSDPFVSASPSAFTDFMLHAAPNPAIGAGVAVPVLSDFGMALRVATRDVGAWAYAPSAGTAPAAPVLLP